MFIGEYAIPRDATINGKPNINVLPEDSYGTSYGFWYNSQAQIVAFTIDSNRECVKLEKVNIGEHRAGKSFISGKQMA